MKESSRDKVLRLLESAKGSYLSGEELAADVGISRTAVWKAVKKLQSEGFSIDAVTNKGYCLAETTDMLSEASIRAFLAVSEADHDVHDPVPSAPFSGAAGSSAGAIEMDVFDTVDSTNTVCLKRASSGGTGNYAAVAGCQTQGRGRRGRSFFSPEGTGLYMSILLRPHGLGSEQAMKLTTIAAVAVSEAIEAVSGKTASIKWVNDIYVDGRKVCGILTEASFNPEGGTLDYAVVGIGINVYEPDGGFPDDIRDRAGSVSGPESPDGSPDSCRSYIVRNGGRNCLAAEILRRFYAYCSTVPGLAGSISAASAAAACRNSLPDYTDEYRRRCFVTGMDVDVIRAGMEPVKAYVLGIDYECHLIVRYGDGSEEVLSSGEISIRL